jgi:hypothetical protein
MPKKKNIATLTMEGTRKRGTPCKRWRNDNKEDLNVTGIKNRQAMARDCQNGERIILDAKVHNKQHCSRNRIRMRNRRKADIYIYSKI